MSVDEDISVIFSPSDMNEISVAVNNTQNEKDEQFKMSWDHILEAIKHEMYPKLSSAIKSIINYSNNQQNMQVNEDDEKNTIKIELYDLTDKSRDNVIEFLKEKRKLKIEERKYLYGLINRARSFNPNTQCMFQ
eukprot:233106_1